MTTYDNSGITGTVTFSEKDDNTTDIKVHMMGAKNLSYMMHIHNGSISAPGGVAIDLGAPTASGGMIDNTTNSTKTYDELVAFNGCFVAHNPEAAQPLTSYVLVGNIGSNAQ